MLGVFAFVYLVFAVDCTHWCECDSLWLPLQTLAPDPLKLKAYNVELSWPPEFLGHGEHVGGSSADAWQIALCNVSVCGYRERKTRTLGGGGGCCCYCPVGAGDAPK